MDLILSPAGLGVRLAARSPAQLGRQEVSHQDDGSNDGE
jgi:hypothetical protein